MVTETYSSFVKVCQSCGAEIYSGAKICPNCGTRQVKPGRKGKKSRITAAVLALLLGGIGAHKFYLGKMIQGLLYLIFSWTLIPCVLALFDFIVLIVMSDERFDAIYGKPEVLMASTSGNNRFT